MVSSVFGQTGTSIFESMSRLADRRITREAGVTAIPISAFYDARNVHSRIRFCFAKSDQTLQEAVQRLARWREGLNWKAAS